MVTSFFYAIRFFGAYSLRYRGIFHCRYISFEKKGHLLGEDIKSYQAVLTLMILM